MSIDSDATNSDRNPDPDLDRSDLFRFRAEESSTSAAQTGIHPMTDSSGTWSASESLASEPYLSVSRPRASMPGNAGKSRKGPITGPIFTASTYTFESTDALLRFVEGLEQREEYGRYGTPNERSVEAKLAALEGAEDAIVYSSGMAAIVGLLMSKLNRG